MTLFKTLALSTIILTVTVWGSTPAWAVPTTFIYEGIIDDLGAGAGDPAFQAFLGETLRVEYTFESTTPDTEAVITEGEYTDPAGLLTVTAGPNTYISSPGLFIRIVDFTFDRFAIRETVIGPLLGGTRAESFFFLDDSSGTAFSSDALPLTPPDPADFDQLQFEIAFFDANNDDDVVGVLGATVFRVVDPGDDTNGGGGGNNGGGGGNNGSAVPEPVTAVLGVMGVGVLGIATRRRRNAG